MRRNIQSDGFRRFEIDHQFVFRRRLDWKLACLFAERTLTHFFGGAEIGESIRQARLDVLQTGNPLGLVYIPFVLASVILRKAS